MPDVLDPYLNVLAGLASTDELSDSAFRKLILASSARQNQVLDEIKSEIKNSATVLNDKIENHLHKDYLTNADHKILQIEFDALRARVDSWQNRAIGIGIGAALAGLAGGAGAAAVVAKLFGT